MKILKVYDLTVSTGSYTVDLSKNKLGDSIADSVYIQVIDDCDIAVSGAVTKDVDSEPLAVICMTDLIVKDSIEEAGIYVIDANALSSLTLEVEGTSEIIIKVLG